jgi:hypothetical protein
MTGSVPSEVGNLSNLGYLDVQGSRLTGSLPALDKLTKLTYLATTSNVGLGGNIPALPTTLRELYVSNCAFTALPPNLGALTALRTIIVEKNKFIGAPSVTWPSSVSTCILQSSGNSETNCFECPASGRISQCTCSPNLNVATCPFVAAPVQTPAHTPVPTPLSTPAPTPVQTTRTIALPPTAVTTTLPMAMEPTTRIGLGQACPAFNCSAPFVCRCVTGVGLTCFKTCSEPEASSPMAVQVATTGTVSESASTGSASVASGLSDSDVSVVTSWLGDTSTVLIAGLLDSSDDALIVAIVGSVVGVLLILSGLSAFLVWRLRRKKRGNDDVAKPSHYMAHAADFKSDESQRYESLSAKELGEVDAVRAKQKSKYKDARGSASHRCSKHFDNDFTSARAEAWVIDSDDLELGTVLGQGAFGVVRRAEWHGRTVAVKQIKNRLAAQYF